MYINYPKVEMNLIVRRKELSIQINDHNIVYVTNKLL